MTELVEVVARVHAEPAQALVRWSSDERTEQLFGRFPLLRTDATERAGIFRDGGGDTLVHRALEPA